MDQDTATWLAGTSTSLSWKSESALSFNMSGTAQQLDLAASELPRYRSDGHIYSCPLSAVVQKLSVFHIRRRV